MAKPTITTRASKGSALTWTEGDTNLTNLRDATITVAGDTGSTATDLNGTVTISGGTALTSSVSGSTLTVNLDNTAVTAGSYTYASITVDAQGRLTAASNGTTPLVSGGALGTPSSGTVTNLTGTASININGTVGATTPTTGSFTDLTVSGTVTAGGSAGTSGQVLQSTGTGVQWGTASGGGNNIIVLTMSSQLAVPDTADGALSPNWTLQSSGGISGVSADSNTLTLPAGTYLFECPIAYCGDTSPPSVVLKRGATSLALLDNTSVMTATVSGNTRAAWWAPKYMFTLASSGTVRLYKSGSYPGFQVTWNEPRGGALVFRFIKTA